MAERTAPSPTAAVATVTPAAPPTTGRSAPDVEPLPARRPGTSVRTRVLVAVLLMTGLGLLVTGLTSYLISSADVDARIEQSLQQEVDEFGALAAQGVDPTSGQRFATVEQVLSVAIERNVPDDDESLVTFVDGVAVEVPYGERPVRLNEEPAVLALVRSLPADAPTTVREVPTASGPVRIAAVQVTNVAQPGVVGTYVVGVVVDDEREPVVASARTYAVVAAVLWVLIGVVAFGLMSRLLRPISLLQGTARRISRTDLSERIPVRGRDDVSELAATFNEMLDRLEAAFTEQQVFLDDAGHELRTPVTILRGHLELLDPDDAAEVAETRLLLLDETDRMGRLVDDLITLAKARRTDFVILGDVHVSSLVDDASDKARALGDRRWTVDERADVDVRADGQRITQAVLQLVDNAVKFTAAGDVVALGSRVDRTAVDGAHVRIWVRDNGPGVSADEAARVFERFGRAETGRGVEGSGLGLAIVAAIAAAHDGHVELDSRPGHGSTFTLVLPLEAPSGAAPTDLEVP